jgi:hypothetical protein
MGEHLLKAEHIAGKCGSPIVDYGFPYCRPGAGSREHIHTGAVPEHLPASAFKQGEERRLVEVPEGITFVRIDDKIDLGMGHGAIIARQRGSGAAGQSGVVYELGLSNFKHRDVHFCPAAPRPRRPR